MMVTVCQSVHTCCCSCRCSCYFLFMDAGRSSAGAQQQRPLPSRALLQGLCLRAVMVTAIWQYHQFPTQLYLTYSCMCLCRGCGAAARRAQHRLPAAGSQAHPAAADRQAVRPAFCHLPGCMLGQLHFSLTLPSHPACGCKAGSACLLHPDVTLIGARLQLHSCQACCVRLLHTSLSVTTGDRPADVLRNEPWFVDRVWCVQSEAWRKATPALVWAIEHLPRFSSHFMEEHEQDTFGRACEACKRAVAHATQLAEVKGRAYDVAWLESFM